MYVPTFSLTHKMVNHLIRLELAIHDIKVTPLSETVQKKLFIEQSTRNIESLASLLNITISKEQAADIASGREIPLPSSPMLVLANYRSTNDFIYSSSNDPYLSLSSSLLLHLNKLLLNGVVESWEYGRFRSIADTIVDVVDPWLKKRQIQKLERDPQLHFTEVLNWFGDKKFHIHSLIKCACVIFELYRWYPFSAGNLVTILSATELLMEKSRFSLKGLFPIAQNVYLHQEEYLSILNEKQPGKSEAMDAQTEPDMTMWVETFVNAVASDMSAVKNDVVCAAERKIQIHRERMLTLSTRQQKLMRYLQYHPKISRKGYVDMTGVSTMTAYRDLNELVQSKLVLVRGGGRSTFYMLPTEQEPSSTEVDVRKHRVVRIIKDSDLVV